MKFANEPYLQSVIIDYTQGNKPIDISSIIEYFNTKNIVLSSKVSQLSRFKTILKNIRNDEILSQLKMPLEERMELMEIQKKQQEKLHTSPLNISKNVIKSLLKLIKSNDLSGLYTALLLVSGRRPRELYLMARNGITKTGNRSLLFKEQLKKRIDTEPYNIPLLVSFGVFKKALDHFILLNQNRIIGTSDEIYERFKKNNANYIKKINEKLGIDIKASDLRRLYAKLSYDIAKKKGYTGTFNAYTMEVLGHDSIGVSLNYTNQL